MTKHHNQKDSALKLFDRKSHAEFMRPFMVPPGQKISLAKDYDPDYKAHYLKKSDSKSNLQAVIEALKHYQDMLYAQNTYSLPIIFQAMDAAGKDSTIKHVMSGINPQGCQVHSFKAPSTEELDHDYLWRCSKALPERGRIGIFNRSYYEEILVTRVHPEIIEQRQLPPSLIDPHLWKQRFEEINNFENYLVKNGTAILKFFLNVSKAEQKQRFLERIDRPEKNWKFSTNDAKERVFWDDYMTWNMRLVLAISTVLGVIGVVSAFGLFYLGERVFHLDRAHIQTLMYLKLSVAGHLTIFLTRTRGPFWSIRPARILLMAVFGTQAVATLIAVYGLFMTPLGWGWALFVWGYALAWFLVNDRVKLFAYRLLMPRRLRRRSSIETA